MSPSPEPLIVVSRPCPRRARAIERLVAGTLGSPDREAIERHVKTCRNCQGYRDWLRLEARTARSLSRRTPKKVSLDKIRHDLEQQIVRIRASEAAQALVRLAEWYIIRRENADPCLYLGRHRRDRGRLADRVALTIQSLASSPWLARPIVEPGDVETAVREIEAVPRSQASRLLLDLAVTIDSNCHSARVTRGYLIREAGFDEMALVERDWEALMATDIPKWQAQALSQRAGACSILRGDLDQAIQLEERAHRLAPHIVHFAFNRWFLKLIVGHKEPASRDFHALESAACDARHRTRVVRSALPSFRVVLQSAVSEGFLTKPKGMNAIKRLTSLYGE